MTTIDTGFVDDVAPGGIDNNSKRKVKSTSNMTKVLPNDLDAMTKDELVDLVRTFASEKDTLTLELEHANKKLKLGGGPPKVLVSSGPPTTAKVISPTAAALQAPTEKEIAAFRKRIHTKIVRGIKKTIHKLKTKPCTEISEGVKDPGLINAFMKDYADLQTSDTKRMAKWSFKDDTAIAALFGLEENIKGVKYIVAAKVLKGEITPRAIASAGYKALDVKYEKAEATVTFKIRTYTAHVEYDYGI